MGIKINLCKKCGALFTYKIPDRSKHRLYTCKKCNQGKLRKGVEYVK